MDAPLIAQPKLLLPPAEAAHLTAAYAKASVILEYGTGGSTVLAGEGPDCTVFSVESDRRWFDRMSEWFAMNPPKGTVHMHHANIGPTGKWGMPATEAHFRRWTGYPVSVWDRPDFRHPDTVLIDGRFRIACLLTVALRINRPVIALVDDYAVRSRYQQVETLLRPARMIGRMAEFELTPMAFPVDQMGLILTFFLRPG